MVTQSVSHSLKKKNNKKKMKTSLSVKCMAAEIKYGSQI